MAAEPKLIVNSADGSTSWSFSYTKETTAEDICIRICRDLKITPAVRHIFALKVPGGKNVFLMPSQTFTEKKTNFEFRFEISMKILDVCCKKLVCRVRFKVSNIEKLKTTDVNAYNYFFHQARYDVLKNRVPDLIYDKFRWELVGLGITDMYRAMLEDGSTRETVESDYKKYMPNEVLKRHAFFIKRPIQTTLAKLQRAGYDKWLVVAGTIENKRMQIVRYRYVKAQYLKQLNSMAPEYLVEDYTAYKPEDNTTVPITIRVSPYHPTEPGLKYCYDTKKNVSSTKTK